MDKTMSSSTEIGYVIRDGQIVEDFGCIPNDLPPSAYLEKYGAKAAIIWPLIDVKTCKDIPADYPGPMCFPITFLDKIERNDGGSGFLVVGKMHHGVLENGNRPFQKLIVVNTALRARLAEPEGTR